MKATLHHNPDEGPKRDSSSRVNQRKKLTRLHMRYPRNEGPLPQANGRGVITHPLDSFIWVVLAIRIRQDRIHQARFVSSDHPKLKACASLLTELVSGQNVEYALNIYPRPFSKMLYLQPDDLFFVSMVLRAMDDAIADAIKRERDPGYGVWF